jgi:hypothetical protein
VGDEWRVLEPAASQGRAIAFPFVCLSPSGIGHAF